jgi:hypothetical protein
VLGGAALDPGNAIPGSYLSFERAERFKGQATRQPMGG